MRRGVAFLLLLSGLLACQRNVPVINETYYQRNVRKDALSGGVIHELVFFMNVSDGDGFEDLESLQLFYDAGELYWELTADTWHRTTENDQNWIGSNSLRLHDGASFPAGDYRVVLKDVSGESDMKYIQLGKGPSRFNFPEVKVEGSKVTISGKEKAYALRVYNSSDKFLTEAIHYIGDELNLEDKIVREQNVRVDYYFDLYYFNIENGIGFIYGPFYPKTDGK